MAEQYRFFGSKVGDEREYNQTEFAEVFDRILSTGILPGVGAELIVTQTDPARLAVRVDVGEAWVRGYWYQNGTPKEINLNTAHASNPRIDRIILRLDTVNERKIEAVVKTGTPGVTPSPPALEQTEQFWEISLATVRVNANVTSITNTNITDNRAFSEAIGIADVVADIADIDGALQSHISATSTHGATSAATANRIALRDGSGRLKAATPSAADDLTTKAYVDSTIGTSAATANALVRRDGAGRAKVAAPSAADDIARKDTVDAHANNKNNPHSVTKAQVGLGSVENYGIATQAEAQAGSINTKYMTPQRVKQAIDANRPYASGSFTGTGTISRSITTGFAPSAVFVFPGGPDPTGELPFTYFNSGLAAGQNNSNKIVKQGNGFAVGFNTNTEGQVYNYIAFR